MKKLKLYPISTDNKYRRRKEMGCFYENLQQRQYRQDNAGL